MIKRQIITILLALGASSIALCQTSGVEQGFKQKLESASSRNKTIACDFVQIKKVKNVKRSVESRGQFFYDNSGLLALIYSDPKGDKMVMDGEKFTLVTAGKQISIDAASNPMMAQISFMMQACMSGDVTKLGRGWGMTVEKQELDYQVILKPTDRRVQKYISALSMLFDAADLTLNKLRIEERSGGYTEYRFVNKKFNLPIERTNFKTK